MRRFHLICGLLVLVSLFVAATGFAENVEVRGTLTIGPDKCMELPLLAGTSWIGTADISSALGFDFDQPIAVTITAQKEHLFTGLITAHDFYAPPKDWVDAPIYGALIGCYKIKMSTGQTVLHADLNETGDVISGYYFSTDPLDGPPFDQLDSNPHMATFEFTLDPGEL